MTNVRFDTRRSDVWWVELEYAFDCQPHEGGAITTPVEKDGVTLTVFEDYGSSGFTVGVQLQAETTNAALLRATGVTAGVLTELLDRPTTPEPVQVRLVNIDALSDFLQDPPSDEGGHLAEVGT